MTWSYDDSLSTDRDKVRLRVGDINTTDQWITNEAIDYVLDLVDDNVVVATYECAKIMLANPLASRANDRTGTGFSASRSQRFQNLKDIVKQSKADAGLNASPTLTGSSVSEKETLDADTDFVPAAFAQGMNDND